MRYQRLDDRFEEFLRDESRRTGRAETISFLQSEEEIAAQLAEIRIREIPVTIQGARTGIVAGAVPEGGHVLNLSRMKRILGLRRAPEGEDYFLTLEPGVLLEELNEALAAKDFNTEGWSRESLESLEQFKSSDTYFFPPDPTETTASLGGMVACNASGARTFFYGPTRRYIESLRIVLVGGEVVELGRGGPAAQGRRFSLEVAGGAAAFEQVREGKSLSGELPGYRLPAVKNAAGYYVQDDMDLIDLFIGSEGTLGVISQITCRLIPAPRSRIGITSFLTGDRQVLRFVRAVRGEAAKGLEGLVPVKPRAIEFFDCRALELLRRQKRSNPAFEKIPEPPEGRWNAVFVEYHPEDKEEEDKILGDYAEILGHCGGDIDSTWMVESPQEAERQRDFRHAVPEAVNLLIDERRKQEPGLTKLGTDMAVPDDKLEWVLSLYRHGLEDAGLDYVIFGHIGNNHLHVNILPDNKEEYGRGWGLYREWARQIIQAGGTVSAEHGIGKFKRELLAEMYGQDGITAMRKLRELFDPYRLLNRGNLFL